MISRVTIVRGFKARNFLGTLYDVKPGTYDYEHEPLDNSEGWIYLTGKHDDQVKIKRSGNTWVPLNEVAGSIKEKSNDAN